MGWPNLGNIASSVASGIGSLFGPEDEATDTTSLLTGPLNQKEQGFDWGRYIGPALQTGLSLYSGINQAGQLEQAQKLKDQANADQLAWDKEKFYAALNAKGGGGGAQGPDPRMLAMQRQQINDANFSNQSQLAGDANKQNSESIRGFIAAMHNAYK